MLPPRPGRLETLWHPWAQSAACAIDSVGFTDAFARRIATFDKGAVAGIKKLVDVATLPEDEEFAPG